MNTTRLLMLAAAAGCIVACNVCVRAEEAPSDAPRAWPAEMAPELRRIQRELGGSIVEGYEGLSPQGDSAKPPATADPRQAAAAVWASDSDHRSREATLRVEALREAAANLDKMANLLEPLELYSQADALREQAQRLRLDARRMSNGGRLIPAPAAEAVRPPMLYAPPSNPGNQRGPMPENERPALQEGTVPPQLEPESQEPRDEGSELTPAPLSQ